ncbi:MAG: hypothetical protein J7K23_03695 [Thermoproteales archaeon]|nr:hypothetical protein [Thermoproteales archaeon]
MFMKKIGRFQVMALLQAARYYHLTKDKEKAFSWGLNRAIFYAWAKKYGKYAVYKPRQISKVQHATYRIKKGEKVLVYVGNEGVYVGPDGWFMIGNKEQKPEDFIREISRRIEKVMSFEEAWKQALEYVGKFDRKILLDQEKFYKLVYKPVRDSFPKMPSDKDTKQTKLFD